MITNFIRVSCLIVLFVFISIGASSANEQKEYMFRSAAGSGNLDAVKEFLNDGVDVNSSSNRGYTALISASLRGHTAIVNILLENGADVNARDNDGDSPLMASISKGHTDVAKLLLGNGADVNMKDRQGITPLIKAAGKGNTEIVRILLIKGADVNARSYSNETAMMAAKKSGNKEIANMLSEKEANAKIAKKELPKEEKTYTKKIETGERTEERSSVPYIWAEKPDQSNTEVKQNDEEGMSTTFKVSSVLLFIGGVLLLAL
jgi:serine/threonine-protein phosphatase 6 regulatory ankyrin repeat subunit B